MNKLLHVNYRSSGVEHRSFLDQLGLVHWEQLPNTETQQDHLHLLREVETRVVQSLG